MPLKLMLITNDKGIAIEAQNAGVDRIFIDLEQIGKIERQGHLDTVISSHSIQDISNIRGVIDKAEILVRTNPIHDGSKKEVDEILACGADIIMLPMIKMPYEVEQFVALVNGRAKVSLLIETPQAMVRFDDIINISGIDEIHIGLNDMHLGMGVSFMFELLSGGIVEYLCRKIAARGITYGFGGIARLGQGMLPAELIIGEHYRLGSEIVILSREFHKDFTASADLGVRSSLFSDEIKKIRKREAEVAKWNSQQFEANQSDVSKIVNTLVKRLNSKGA